MIYFLGAFSLASIAVILLPFFTKNIVPLDSGQNISNVESLHKMKQKILEQFLLDEKSFQGNQITRKEWTKRQDYLAARFVDYTRRIDFLTRN